MSAFVIELKLMQMKYKLGLGLLLFIAFLNLFILLSGKLFLYRVMIHTMADLDDYKIFPRRYINKSPLAEDWPVAKTRNFNSLSPALRRELEDLKSVALLIIKNDSIRYEEYWEGYNDSAYSNSFSMSKSYVNALIGISMKKGYIKSLDQKVSEFLPEFKEGDKSRITLRHLLTMSSGLNWTEEYMNPLSSVSEAYYGDNIRKLIGDLTVTEEPGKVFRYKGSDTQILAFVLEKISGKTLSKYVEQSLWHPLGSVHAAIWSLDHEDGTEKASCCLNSNAREFARLGQLYLNKGSWHGKNLISPDFIEASVAPMGLPDKDGVKADYYGYQWWVVPEYKGMKIFYARGVGGQYIIVVPNHRMVIVRLGHKRGERTGKHFKELFDMIDEGIKMK
jgi:CubicO group peptidase (beta-lactamase class C family)